jgi:hypothetical protein
MPMPFIQHAVVTMAALVAVAMLARRAFGAVCRRPSRTDCAGCPVAQHVCGTRLNPPVNG